MSLFGCSATTTSQSKDHNVKVKTTEAKKDQENASTQKAQEPTANSQKQTTDTSTATNDNSSSNSNPSTQVNSNSNQTKSTVKNQPAAVQPNPAPATKPAATTNPAPTTKPASQNPVQTVQLIIVGPKEQSNINKSLTVKIKNSDTVLDVLLRGIGQDNVDYSGSGATAYVKGIENVYELDYGPKSGWTVSQNGTKLVKSAGVIQVRAGDKIEWGYTKDYTENK